MAQEKEEKTAGQEKAEKGKGKIHFSIDDFFTAFIDLTENRKENSSLFEQPVFAFFKRLHQDYQAVFSCFCFYEEGKDGRNLAQVTDVFREEFQENSDWLRFGFHGLNSGANYGSTRFQTGECRANYRQAGEDYEKTVKELERITGGGRCIDRVPRIHFYAGTAEACRAWMDASCGIRGLISAEDDRIAYFHTEEQSRTLRQQDRLDTTGLGLTFFRTKVRLENTEDIAAFLEDFGRQEKMEELLVFTHEPFLEEERIRQMFRSCAAFARERDWGFGFPEDWLEREDGGHRQKI